MARNIGADKKSSFRCRRFWLRAVPAVCLFLLLVFIVSLPLGSCQWTRLHYMCQTYVYPARNEPSIILFGNVKEALLVEVSPPKSYTGVWRTWFSNGQIYSETPLLDGQPHGKVCVWQVDGLKQEERDYVRGQLDGKVIEYLGGGDVHSIRHYSKGKRHGAYVGYHLNGQKRCVVNWRNDERFGKHESWYGNGVKSTEGYFDGNISEGKDESGTEVTYGTPSGLWKKWDRKGKLIASGSYKDGRRWKGTFWDFCGSNFEVYGQTGHNIWTYKNGKRSGAYLHFYAGGEMVRPKWRKAVEGKYVNDQKSGEWRYWNKTGKPLAKGIYRHGKPYEGSFRLWDGSVRRWVIRQYREGKRLDLQPEKSHSPLPPPPMPPTAE